MSLSWTEISRTILKWNAVIHEFSSRTSIFLPSRGFWQPWFFSERSRRWWSRSTRLTNPRAAWSGRGSNRLRWLKGIGPPGESYNVGKTIRNQPFENGLYNLFMVKFGMVYSCFVNNVYIYYIYICIYIYFRGISWGYHQQFWVIWSGWIWSWIMTSHRFPEFWNDAACIGESSPQLAEKTLAGWWSIIQPEWWVLFGKRLHNYGKSPCLMGKSM